MIPIKLFFFVAIMVLVSPAYAQVEDIASLSVQIPYGMKEGKGLAVENSSFAAYFSMESFYQGDMNVDLNITFPKEFEIKEPDKYSFKLQTEYDNWYKFIEINIPPNTPSGIYSIKTTANISTGSQSWYIERESILRVVSKEELSKIIKINKIIIPSSEEGKETEYQENALVLKEPSPILKKIFWAGKNKIDPMAITPIAYVGIEVENRGEENAIILVSFEVLDMKRDLAPGFKPPAMGAGANFSFAPVNMRAQSKELVILPVYADEDIALGGEYIARSAAKVFGTDFPASSKENTIKVISRNWTSVYVTIFALLLTISALLVFFVKHDVIFRNFKTKYMVMISLFGTVAFATINVPMTFLWEISHAVFGPFSSLFTGIFYEIVFYTIVVSLLVLIPKIGVVSILIMVRFILNGIIFGSLSPVFLISYGFQAIAIEAALYLTGITRGIKPEDKKIPLSVNLGIADALGSYVSFNLFIFLYRLFYADWYIIMSMTITGFVYTFIGVLLGISIGQKLKKVVE